MTQAPSSLLRVTLRRVFRLENRRRTPRPGRLEHLRAFPSAVFGNERDLTIYLPPGYGEHEDVRYPVLYMQDGQNLFEPERAFIPGQHWRLAEAADEAIAARTAQPMIIVGVDHAGPARADEYTPSYDAKKKVGGRADDYARFLLDEVKPAIDSRFRTDARDTAIGGSSLGGLIALHLGLTNPDVFRAIAALSPSVWWDNRQIVTTAPEAVKDATLSMTSASSAINCLPKDGPTTFATSKTAAPTTASAPGRSGRRWCWSSFSRRPRAERRVPSAEWGIRHG